MFALLVLSANLISYTTAREAERRKHESERKGPNDESPEDRKESVRTARLWKPMLG